jgi:signal transduction histidine kinase
VDKTNEEHNSLIAIFLMIIDSLPLGFSCNRMIYNGKEPNDFRILYYNQEFSNVIPIDDSNITGRTLSEILPIDENIKTFLDNCAAVAETGSTFRSERYNSNQDKWFNITVVSPAEEIFIITIFDITDNKTLQLNLADIINNLEAQLIIRTTKLQETIDNLEIEIAERKLVEQKLLDAKEELQILLKNEQKLRELKDKFLNVLLQEFRDPISVIKTSVDLLRIVNTNGYADTTPAIFERMDISIQQLVDAMENIHLLSDDEIKHSVDREEFDLITSCKEIIEEVKANDEYKHIINLIAYKEPIHCQSDKLIIQAIMRILLKNSCQYSSLDSNITVEIIADEYFYNLIVKDDGIGIPDEELSMIFEPLYRGTNVRNTTFGTGLGLAIVQKYSEMLNAEVYVGSQPNEGTRFIISIPKANF